MIPKLPFSDMISKLKGPVAAGIKKPKGVWVFEIGNPLLKGAYFLKQGRVLRVEKIVTEPLPHVNQKEAIDAFFKKISAGENSNTPTWILIARNMTTLRHLELPSTEPKELAAIVDLQIGKQTPYNRDEIVSDWKSSPTSREGFSRVVLAIIHHMLTVDYLGAMKDTHFVVEKVGLVSSGISYFIPKENQKLQVLQVPLPKVRGSDDSEEPGTFGRGTLLVLDVDAFYTELQIVAPSEHKQALPRLLFSRAIPVGENRLGENEAEGWEKLFAEVKRSLEIAQQEQIVQAPPKQAFLSGASRHQQALAERLTQELGMTCLQAPSLDQFFKLSDAAKQELEKSCETNSFYGLLGALAVPPSIHFDLMPAELKLRSNLEQRTQQLVRLGLLLGVFVMLISGFCFEQIYKKNTVLELLDKRYEATVDRAREVEKMRDVLESLRRRMNSEEAAIEFMRIIHEVTPEDIYYTNILFEEGKAVSLKGNSKSSSAIFNFVSKLDKTNPFQHVETKYATKKKIKEEELVEFEIAGRFGKA